jgi:16S rRNA (guanine(966)-N(2))-methyltransferase RsmD
VIAGRFGGRPLVAPRGRGTRPTSDRVREAVFSVLGTSVQCATVLDLFAGSGAMAIEAISRGAASAELVDSSAAAIATIRRNLTALGIAEEVSVERSEALRYLERARSAKRQYDLVFLDPPYRHASTLGGGLTELVGAVLAPGAQIVTESDRRAPLDLGLPLMDERRYGDTLIRIHGPR